MDKIKILYFLEDRAQEGFIKAFVNRIAGEESINVKSLENDIRSARGGSRAAVEFRKFMRYAAKAGMAEIDFLVVAVDGNCKGYNERVKELDEHIKGDHPLKGKVVYAIPDPHIERWYLMDQRALKIIIGVDRAPDMPPYKCEKNYYMQLLNRTLKEADIGSLLGGTEYAEKIVGNMEDLYSLGKQDAVFQAFMSSLRGMFRRIKGMHECSET